MAKFLIFKNTIVNLENISEISIIEETNRYVKEKDKSYLLEFTPIRGCKFYIAEFSYITKKEADSALSQIKTSIRESRLNA